MLFRSYLEHKIPQPPSPFPMISPDIIIQYFVNHLSIIFLKMEGWLKNLSLYFDVIEFDKILKGRAGHTIFYFCSEMEQNIFFPLFFVRIL